MPALGGRRPSTWQFTTFPSKTTITETQVGKGSIDWEHLTWEQDPTQFHIVNALADLPNLGVIYTAVTKGLLTLSQKEIRTGDKIAFVTKLIVSSALFTTNRHACQSLNLKSVIIWSPLSFGGLLRRQCSIQQTKPKPKKPRGAWLDSKHPDLEAHAAQ
jgi:hypothetical protein